MIFNNLKVIFQLDGTGIIYNEPIHLDSLIAYSYLDKDKDKKVLNNDDTPDDFELPLDKWVIDNYWGWKASVLLPENNHNEYIQYFRRKLNDDRMELTTGSCNYQGGYYKISNNPESLMLINKMIAYCRGDKDIIREKLREIKSLGKRRNVGKGKIINIAIEEIVTDYSCVMDSTAMRYLPDKNGIRSVRIRPPYWNRIDRINVCEIGDHYEV